MNPELNDQAARGHARGHGERALLLRLVMAARRSLRWAWVLTGAGRLVALVVGLLALAVMVDLAWPLPRIGRLAAAAIVLAGAAVMLVAGVALPLSRRLTPARMARRLESLVPGMQNRLMTAIDILTGKEPDLDPHAFRARIIREASERVSGLRPSAVVNRDARRQAGLLAIVALGLLLALLRLFPERAPTAVSRIVHPFADIPPVTRVAYTVAPGDGDVLRGDAVVFTATVTRGAPEHLRLALMPADGRKPLWYDLRAGASNRWHFVLEGYEHPFDYRVYGGGTWSRRHRITLADRPMVVELETRVHYPDYMAMTEPVRGKPQEAEIHAPAGSVAEVRVRVAGDVKRGEIRVAAAATGAGTVAHETATFGMQALTNGWWGGRFPVERDGSYQFTLLSPRGHRSRDMQPAAIVTFADAAPQVVVERPGADVVLSEGAALPVVATAYDDFGLAEVALQVNRDGVWTPHAVTNSASPRRNDRMARAIDLAKLGLRAGQQLSYRVAARDRYTTVEVPPPDEEPAYLHANNRDAALVRVSREQLRVLYIDGAPRWDFRFLKNAIRRDRGLRGREADEADILLEHELRRRPTPPYLALPRTTEALNAYHVVILGDVSPALLDPAFVRVLDTCIREDGLGLIVMAGPRNMPHRYGEVLQTLLPVRLLLDVAGIEPPTTRPFRIDLTPDGALHPALRLYDDQGRNERLWREMPPYYWCAAVRAPAVGATVLAWNPDVGTGRGRLPLVAYHYAGQGKVFFVGTDATWRWREDAGDRYFYKFWGQAIRYVARHDRLGQGSWIDVQPPRAQPGEQVRVELMDFATDADRLSARVMHGSDVRELELAADRTVKGRYVGSFQPRTTGDYRVLYEPRGAAAAEAVLRVFDPSLELRYPGIHRGELAMLAEATGGRLIELHALASVVEHLRGEPTLTPVHRESSIWDNALTLGILVLLYCLDIALRRLKGLT